MPRQPPKRGQQWRFCRDCKIAISRGFRTPDGHLICTACWKEQQDSEPEGPDH
jgi:hypothetical protein